MFPDVRFGNRDLDVIEYGQLGIVCVHHGMALVGPNIICGNSLSQ